tara:strand:- start:94 stop:729 length:636 start_codon:yes stop_codon:yes gene_type:complete
MFLKQKLNKISNEERWNVYTHLPAIILSIIGGIDLLFIEKSIFHKINLGDVIYIFSLIFLFTCSTVYHLVSGPLKIFWRRLDHIAIFILIAGTYTPVCLNTLIETPGKVILYSIWTIAFLGILFKIFFINKYEVISLLLYIGMGWILIFDINSIIKIFNFNSLLLLFMGGAFYTTGVVFYRMNNLAYNHAIWHVFIVLGAISHFLMIKELI